MPANSVPPSRRSVATHDPSIAPSSNSSSTQYLNPPVVTISSNQTSPVKRIFTVTRTKSGDVGQQTNLSTQLLPSSAHPNTNTTWGMVHTPGRNRTPQRSPTRTGTAAYLDAHNTYISNLRTSMAHDTFSHPRSYAAQQPTHLSSLSHGDTSHTIENRLVRSNLQDELNADHSVPSSLPLLPISATTQHSVAESHRALIRAERDLESVREELNRTRSELDDVRKNLERERDDKTRSMTSLQSQAEKTQEEMGRRHRELLDQIAVLKSLNDAATEERTRILEEHEQRKQHYTSLLEHERNEKTRLLDEYRGQTEALLSDQGKEIESLRSLLDTETSKEKTMVQELHDAQQRRTDLELALRRAETALADERSIRQKSTNSVENDANNKVHMINETHERNAREWKATLERVTAAKEQLQEQLVAAMNQTEALRNQLSAEREESRRKHEKEIDAVLRELRDAKAWRERSEEQSRAEVDKVTRESEELVVSLRRELEILRSDKQALYEQNRHTKETMMNEHQARLQHLHTSIDNLRKELSEERQSRKDAESMRQTLNVKLDQAHVEIARLHSENERTQLDSRQTERQLSTDHLNLVENLKGQIRTLEGEHLHARSQVKKLEDEVRHWVNQAENLREELVSEQLGARTQAEEARRNYYHIAEQLEENRSSSAKAIEAAQARRIEVEAELARCQSLNEELHAKLSLSSKNLVAERRRVENLTDELCKANAMLDREKGAHQKTLNIVMEKESELEDLIRAKEDALRDRAVARREQDVLREQHERDLERQTEAHNSKMLDCELKSEGFKQEIIALEEQIRAREGTIHDLAKTIESHRNTISKLQVTLNSQNATSRRQYELTENHFSEEIARMEAILQTLKEDLNKSNQARYALQREHAERLREHERQVLALQESCEAERAARVRITEEVRSAEHNQTEQQAMIRMLTTRIQSREEELRKAETELQNTQTKYQECTMHVGRKESQIHQLMARIRALELRVPATPGKLLH